MGKCYKAIVVVEEILLREESKCFSLGNFVLYRDRTFILGTAQSRPRLGYPLSSFAGRSARKDGG